MPRRAASEAVPGLADPASRWRSAGRAPRLLLGGLDRGTWVPIQSQAGRTAYRVEDGPTRYFVKRYRPESLVGRMRDFGVRRKPQRAFARGRALVEAGVGTPAPLGLLLRGGGLPAEALLVTEWLPDAGLWTESLARRAREDRREAGHALTALGGLVGSFHALGYYHGDLAGNLLICGTGPGTRAYLIDLEELRGRLSRKRRVKNLEELGRALPDLEVISLRERWVFLEAYAAAAGLSPASARDLWREGRAAQIRRMAAGRAGGGPGG